MLKNDAIISIKILYVALKYAKPKAPWLTVWPIKQRAQPARWIIRMRVRHMGPPVIHHDVVCPWRPRAWHMSSTRTRCSIIVLEVLEYE